MFHPAVTLLHGYCYGTANPLQTTELGRDSNIQKNKTRHAIKKASLGEIDVTLEVANRKLVRLANGFIRWPRLSVPMSETWRDGIVRKESSSCQTHLRFRLLGHRFEGFAGPGTGGRVPGEAGSAPAGAQQVTTQLVVRRITVVVAEMVKGNERMSTELKFIHHE